MKFHRMIVMGGLALATFAAAGCGRQGGAGRQGSAPAAATPTPLSASPAVVSTPSATPAPGLTPASTSSEPTTGVASAPGATPTGEAGAYHQEDTHRTEATPPAPAPGQAVYASKLPPSAAGKPMTLAEAYPNYKPGADDPELESTKTGRRKVAKHDIPLEPGGAPDLRTLLENVLAAVDVADGPSAQKSAVTQSDFLNIIWPEMPQSRPAARVPGDEAWDFLYNRNIASFNRTMGDFHNKGLRLVSFKVGHVDEYTNYRLHQDILIQAEMADHQPVELDVVRTVVERNGRFKVYSTRD